MDPYGYEPESKRVAMRGDAISIEEWIGKRVTPMPNGCWAFNGSLTKRALTSNSPAGPLNVYKFMYEAMVRPVVKGELVHHACLNPGCVNPAHLEAVTMSTHRKIHHRITCDQLGVTSLEYRKAPKLRNPLYL